MQTHKVGISDSLTPISVQLMQEDENGDLQPSDLSGRDVNVRIVNQAGDVIIDNAEANIIVPENGIVQYNVKPGDFSEAGIYWAWFVVDDGSETDTFPSDGRTFRVLVSDRD